jgi:hypothetical protein
VKSLIGVHQSGLTGGINAIAPAGLWRPITAQ